jgi:quinol monooxygenase YgiN
VSAVHAAGRETVGDHVVIYARFHLKPGKRDAYLALLEPVLRAIEGDPLCKSIVVHEDESNPDLIILYEIWAGTRERFDREERNKAYRETYAARLPVLLARPVEVEWPTPISEWCSNMTRETD